MALCADATISPLSGSRGTSYVLGSEELKMNKHEGFQISFLVFYFSGSVKSFICSYFC